MVQPTQFQPPAGPGRRFPTTTYKTSEDPAKRPLRVCYGDKPYGRPFIKPEGHTSENNVPATLSASITDQGCIYDTGLVSKEVIATLQQRSTYLRGEAHAARSLEFLFGLVFRSKEFAKAVDAHKSDPMLKSIENCGITLSEDDLALHGHFLSRSPASVALDIVCVNAVNPVEKIVDLDKKLHVLSACLLEFCDRQTRPSSMQNFVRFFAVADGKWSWANKDAHEALFQIVLATYTMLLDVASDALITTVLLIPMGLGVFLPEDMPDDFRATVAEVYFQAQYTASFNTIGTGKVKRVLLNPTRYGDVAMKAFDVVTEKLAGVHNEEVFAGVEHHQYESLTLTLQLLPEPVGMLMAADPVTLICRCFGMWHEGGIKEMYANEEFIGGNTTLGLYLGCFLHVLHGKETVKPVPATPRRPSVRPKPHNTPNPR